MLDLGNDPGSAVRRTKRFGSLSIANPLDVLRERVMLQLARRKALQDQQQIDENRRFLEIIGKRSVQEYELDGKIAGDSSTNSHDYTNQQLTRNRSAASERVPSRMQNWFKENDPALQDDQVARV